MEVCLIGHGVGLFLLLAIDGLMVVVLFYQRGTVVLYVSRAHVFVMYIYISNIIKYTYMDTSLSFIKVTHVQCYLAYIYISKINQSCNQDTLLCFAMCDIIRFCLNLRSICAVLVSIVEFQLHESYIRGKMVDQSCYFVVFNMGTILSD